VLSAEQVYSAVSMHLMQHIPKAMHEIPNDEHNWQSHTEETQESETNHACGFETPRSFIAKVRSEY